MARSTATLSADQVATLRLHGTSVQRPCADSIALAKKGLVELGDGRFGQYTRITEKGRNVLASLPGSAHPEPAADAASVPATPPAKRRSSHGRVTAKQAVGHAAESSPSAPRRRR